MKRYQPPAIINMPESPIGDFVLYLDAVEAMQSAIEFAFDHIDDIKNDVNDFGMLKPILAMIEGVEVDH